MTSVELNIWAVTWAINARIKLWIRRAIPILMKALKELTPEDTKTMLNAYRIEEIKDEWNRIIGTISNDTDYAIQVEYWVDWLMFNYHKPRWSVFYTWVWNRTFARAVDRSRNECMNIILNTIEKW